MPLNIEKHKLNLNKCTVRDTKSSWIEQDIVVPDTKPDVIKIVRIDANVYVTDKDAMDGNIKISGNITYYIMYKDENKRIRNVTATYPYTKIIDERKSNSNMNIRVVPRIKNIIYSVPNERKIALKTEVSFRYTLTEIGCYEILTRIDGEEKLEAKTDKQTFLNITGQRKQTIESREDIMLPENSKGASEIIRVETEIVNTEYKISYNKIMVKGEIKAAIIYMDSTEDKEIGIYQSNIPFASVIEFDNISDKSMFDITYVLKNFGVSINNNEVNNNMLTVTYEIEADSIMYEETEISYIGDFYSTNKELKYDVKNEIATKTIETIEKNINLSDTVGTVAMQDTKILDYYVDISGVTTKIAGGNVYISGTVKLSVLTLEAETKGVENKIYEMAMEVTIPLSKDVDEKFVSVNISVENANVKLSGLDIVANINIRIDVKVDQEYNINMIDNIISEEIDENKFDSMNMYIVKKGDSLWDIAKKYKTTVSKIANTNNIENENKLEVGQKILVIR